MHSATGLFTIHADKKLGSIDHARAHDRAGGVVQPQKRTSLLNATNAEEEASAVYTYASPIPRIAVMIIADISTAEAKTLIMVNLTVSLEVVTGTSEKNQNLDEQMKKVLVD
ncbi:hypothetical protein RB195_001866 [Necator americanus]|uniref:Uncharacterized protein n=1 Tax=Necator americanus TaxID=51031 RepID=A0ABR1DG98_NECAM